MPKSFLERMQPKAERSKLVRWPFPTPDGAEVPLIRMKILGSDDIEAAQFEVDEHYRKQKIKIERDSPAYEVRLRAAFVWRAYEADGERLAPSAVDLFKEPPEIVAELYAEWKRYQDELTIQPPTPEAVSELIAALKKNIRDVPLSAWPSTWLTALITTLVNQQSPSTQADVAG